MNVKLLLEEFIDIVRCGNVEIYNEISLQHELGFFLRTKATGYKVEFERNTKHFGIVGTIKHEIDLSIYTENEFYAIELKYPRNGQYPEEMFSFLKDLRFMEELKAAGFHSTYCLTLVDDKNFYSGHKQDGIYTYFRGNKSVHGLITKPTGKKEETIEIRGTYPVDWKSCGALKYYILEI